MKRFTFFTFCLLILACQFGLDVTSTTQPATAVPSGVTVAPSTLTDIPMQIGYGVSRPWF